MARAHAAAVAGLVLALGAASCSDDEKALPACGDGHLDTGEQCDDGNLAGGDGCSARCRDERYGDLLVLWAFNTDQAGKDDPQVFSSDDCTDFVVPGSPAPKMQIRSLSGPGMVDASDGCSLYQTSVSKLPVGDYQLELQLVQDAADGKGAPTMVSKPRTLDVSIPPGMTASPPALVFSNADFDPPPTGTFYFQTYFGEKSAGSCSAAMPAVAEQRLTMTPAGGGAALTLGTKTGVPLDGSKAGPCLWPAGLTDTQSAEKVPSGSYAFKVEGLGSDGSTVACKTFTVFAGAGRSNKTYELLVPAGACGP